MTLKRLKCFFATTNKISSKQLEELGYDFNFDKKLIDISIVSQYHFLPSELENIKHSDYFKLIEGLNGETQLANVIRIRKETDPDKIKEFGRYETEVRVNWQSYIRELEEKERGM